MKEALARRSGETLEYSSSKGKRGKWAYVLDKEESERNEKDVMEMIQTLEASFKGLIDQKEAEKRLRDYVVRTIRSEGPWRKVFVPDPEDQLAAGPQLLTVKSGKDVVFDGEVVVPDNRRVAFTLVVDTEGKKHLTFTPDIRVMKN